MSEYRDYAAELPQFDPGTPEITPPTSPEISPVVPNPDIVQNPPPEVKPDAVPPDVKPDATPPETPPEQPL